VTVDFDGLIVDLDGVVWRGADAVPGSIEAIAGLLARGVQTVFLTNDPQSSRDGYAARLRALGVDVDEEAIVTSAWAMARFIRETEEARTLFAIGSPALKAELREVGLTVLDERTGVEAAVVAVGGHSGFHYGELRVATQALRRGARLYGAGRDATFPMHDGPWPATGAVLAAVEVAGGVEATVVGKPEAYIFDIARALLDGCARIAIVGDNLDADIVGGQRAGLTTILVLSGTANRGDLANAAVQPDIVLDDLAALVKPFAGERLARFPGRPSAARAKGRRERPLVVPSLAELQRRRSKKWAVADGVLSSTVAEMDFSLAEPVVDALRAAIARSDLGYTPLPGAVFRRAMCDFFARRLHWRIDPEQITLVPDVMAGLIELCRVAAAPSHAVGFASPAYPLFFADLPQAGVSIRELALEEDGSPSIGDLERALADDLRVLVVVNPHNPTGRCLERSTLTHIADLCHERGVWVLADEIHAPLVMPGATFTPWLEVSDAARSCGVALTSASKAFNVAGLKAAQIVTASGRARDFVRRLPDLLDRVGLLGVVAAEAGFGEGDEWLDAVIAQLETNRGLLATSLSEQLPSVRWWSPDASFLAWLDCSALGFADEPAAAFLEWGQIALTPGRSFGGGSDGHVRLNFGTSADHLVEMVRRLALASTRGSESRLS